MGERRKVEQSVIDPFDQARHDFSKRLYQDEDFSPTSVREGLNNIQSNFIESMQQRSQKIDLFTLYSQLSEYADTAVREARIRKTDKKTIEGLEGIKKEYDDLKLALFEQMVGRPEDKLPDDMSQAKGGKLPEKKKIEKTKKKKTPPGK